MYWTLHTSMQIASKLTLVMGEPRRSQVKLLTQKSCAGGLSNRWQSPMLFIRSSEAFVLCNRNQWHFHGLGRIFSALAHWSEWITHILGALAVFLYKPHATEHWRWYPAARTAASLKIRINSLQLKGELMQSVWVPPSGYKLNNRCVSQVGCFYLRPLSLEQTGSCGITVFLLCHHHRFGP